MNLKTVRIFFASVAALSLAGFCHAQDRPVNGGHEIEIWTGGGHGTNGSTSSDSVFNAGVRYGWILTKAHGPGFLRGRFEYAVDAVPVFLIFQPANTAYGAGLNPINLKWNFDTDKRLAPYLELGGGGVFTNHTVPTGTSAINFTPTGAIGVHYFGDRLTYSAELRFLHISNAGLVEPNPGINTIEVRVGVGWFTHAQHHDNSH
jgi:lipid A 3-O-deacylase